MTEIIIGIAVVALINFVYKGLGPVVLADREPSPLVQELITAMAPALLAGLITVQLTGPRWSNLDWTALPGLAAAAVAYLRGLPDLVCLGVAIIVTILLRLAV